MSKPLSEYGPKEERTKLLQCHIRQSLHQEVDELRNRLGWTWVEFVTALFEKAIDDNRTKKKVGT